MTPDRRHSYNIERLKSLQFISSAEEYYSLFLHPQLYIIYTKAQENPQFLGTNDLYIKFPINTRNKFAIVDLSDWTKVRGEKWYSNSNTGYIYKNREGITTLHRFVSDSRQGIDHRNRVIYDCRKSNLRPATQKQNIQNRSPKKGTKYRGVVKRTRNFEAKILYQGKLANLGTYETDKEAARVYNHCAKIIYGEFAYLNII